MAASIGRVYTQLSLPRQFLVDAIWKEQSINSILHTSCASKVNYQYYHTSSILLKKRKLKIEKNVKQLMVEQCLKDPSAIYNFKPAVEPVVPTIEVWNEITITELAERLNKTTDDVLDFLLIKHKDKCFVETSVLSSSLAAEVVKGCGAKVKIISAKHGKKELTYEDLIQRPPPHKFQLVKRHPVVTIMGHVDHGKTTLLDALRNTSVVKSEFGGITQHIGAFNVTLKSGERITFLDTPGHAAFSAMRYRGAHITDIVVLVVAADDGVKDQTIQSIEMAKKANVPIIVAINKIDKPNTNIRQTQHELAQHGIIVEELGGDVQCIHISALKGTNLQVLTEAIVLQAEIMNLTGDPGGLVEGVVIECKNDLGRGKLVTALIRRGTLKKRCLLVSGLAWAKVRGMFNDSGQPVIEAKLSEAVEIIGWKTLPNVGDDILEMPDDKTLQAVLKYREAEYNKTLAMEHKVMADKKEEEHQKEYKKFLRIKYQFGRRVFRQLQVALNENNVQNKQEKDTDDIAAFNVIIKGDVSGSVEAILDIFDTYKSNDACRLNVIHYGVGPVVDTDLQLAETFNAIIYGFNVNITKRLEEEAVKKGVSIRFYNVVYKLFDNIKETIASKMPEIEIEDIIGEAKVIENFKIKEKKKKFSYIAGCRCIKGVLLNSAMYKVIRGDDVIFRGKLVSMKHLKDEVSSVDINVECGLKFEDPTIAFLPGDTVICYNPVQQRQQVNWDPGF
ncbi:mitochondrial translation initiation factor 2 isoform X1 [Megachile rotundata]|uniref:mitochondrial translation initiation factor 2 isoform X1 n=1 Tax=Megachile rotundata TaxID=143995 RepID=UPI003FD4CDCC